MNIDPILVPNQIDFASAPGVFNVLTYDPVVFTELKDVIQSYPAQITNEEKNMAAADLSVLEWAQVEIYETVIEADVVTGISKVFPTNTYVLRPAEARQIQDDIDAQVVQIKSEQEAAKNAAEKAKVDYAESLVVAQQELYEKLEEGDPEALKDY